RDGAASGFAPLVAVFGPRFEQRTTRAWRPTIAGACSGRHGGPNARLFAAMANRPEVRAILYERGVHIPPTTWFLGGHSNTASSALTWFDAGGLPPALAPALAKLDADLAAAAAEHARERCRRFASAPAAPAPARARRRGQCSFDFSQARRGSYCHQRLRLGRTPLDEPRRGLLRSAQLSDFLIRPPIEARCWWHPARDRACKAPASASVLLLDRGQRALRLRHQGGQNIAGLLRCDGGCGFRPAHRAAAPDGRDSRGLMRHR
ncbi:MAG: DUF2309 family protein, partial [Sterolibacteriaceae bacterium]|nr:DUF2309 family protein [Sterolibacteriaceae bacterium]